MYASSGSVDLPAEELAAPSDDVLSGQLAMVRGRTGERHAPGGDACVRAPKRTYGLPLK